MGPAVLRADLHELSKERERIWNWIPRYSSFKGRDRKILSLNPPKKYGQFNYNPIKNQNKAEEQNLMWYDP